MKTKPAIYCCFIVAPCGARELVAVDLERGPVKAYADAFNRFGHHRKTGSRAKVFSRRLAEAESEVCA